MMFPFSYIDPGTGSVIAGSLWGVIGAILTAIGAFLMAWFIRPLRRLLSRAWKAAMGSGRFGIFFIIAVAIIIMASVIINYQNTEGFEMGKKVIVLGIDAMDPKVVERMMEEGKLPNLKKLTNSGGYSRLGTTTPPETPVAWSAAATGSNPGGYGIFDFIARDPATYLPGLSLVEQGSVATGTQYASGMKGIPFWKITSDAGIPTSVIKWPVTFPAEKVNGRMLSGLGTVDIRGLLNSYSFYTEDDTKQGPMDAGRIVHVSPRGGRVDTVLYGPRIQKGSEVVDAEVPMTVILGDNPAIQIQGSSYPIGKDGWSPWIRVAFSTGFLRNVYGIFRAYLLSSTPEFGMYVTSVQIDPENQLYRITYPEGYGKELAGEIGLFYTMGQPEDTKAVNEGRISREVFLEQFWQIEGEREKIFWNEFSRFRSGVLAFGFDSGDRMQHIFWETNTPKEIEDYYIQKDGFIGELLGRIDGNTSLIIFSDHGFNAFNRSVCINAWLVENGYMTLTRPPTGDDPGTLFRYVDWNRTEAYSLGFASIFINLKGREGQGIVEPGDKEHLIDEIIEGLSKLSDPETNRKPILKLYRGGEIYSGDFSADAPDIVIGFDEGYRMSWENAVGGSRQAILADNNEEWKGDHLVDPSIVPAVLFANFNITKENPDLTDIAPTVLNLLGLEVPQTMGGKGLVS